jgi:hypothetical protein
MGSGSSRKANGGLFAIFESRRWICLEKGVRENEAM